MKKKPPKNEINVLFFNCLCMHCHVLCFKVRTGLGKCVPVWNVYESFLVYTFCYNLMDTFVSEFIDNSKRVIPKLIYI